MASDTNCSHGKEPECPEIIIDVENAKSAQRCSECCIYMVPKKLREVKPEAYTPKLIPIGPVHHNKEPNHMEHHNKNEVDNKKEQDSCPFLVSLRPPPGSVPEEENMKSLKLRYFKEFFCRRTWKGQKEFANIIMKNEENIRQCYAEEISLPGKQDFVKMILLDSIFIIELFLRTASRSEYEKDDYILSEPWLEEGIKHDLILLENQLPFFILDDLYRHIGSFAGSHNSFLNLARNYFFPNDNCKNIPKEKEVKHFTDLQRYFYYSPKLKSSDRIIAHLYSATKLDAAGLNFKKWEEEPLKVEDRCLLDIKIVYADPLKIFPCFNCSWLLHCLPCVKCFLFLTRSPISMVIPPFVISQETEHVFRNIMALEQCHYPKEAYICNYIVLLDFLINTTEDAELLVDKKIIVHSFRNNQDVIKMVEKLTKEIVEKNSCYSKVARRLNEHYDGTWNKSIVSWWNKYTEPLKTVYFRDIWRGTATIAGIIALLITIANFLMPFFMKFPSL